MIGVIFELGSEYVEIIILDKKVGFRTNPNASFTTIDGLKLSYAGVIKEFPDLKDDPSWESKARERFKEKIKSFNNETAAIDYIIKDLSHHGYIPKYKQRKGFRPEKC